MPVNALPATLVENGGTVPTGGVVVLKKELQERLDAIEKEQLNETDRQSLNSIIAKSRKFLSDLVSPDFRFSIHDYQIEPIEGSDAKGV